MPAGVRRQGEGGVRTLPRLVAAMGMARSTPGCSHTRHTRPRRCCIVVMPSNGSVSP